MSVLAKQHPSRRRREFIIKHKNNN